MESPDRTKIFVAGHRGMVGSAIVRRLRGQGIPPHCIVTCTHDELDLSNQQAVLDFFEREQPTQVYLAAAKVGGIYSNDTYPADHIYDNLMIQCNVIHSAHLHNVQKLVFLGSSCIYPRLALQPMREEFLLTGTLEPTNEPYAVAKIAGIKLCESYNRQHGRDYRCLMPTNLYGPGDNYHLENGHVIPALMRRFHEAKVSHASQVVVWGTGAPKREFLYVDDMAAASVFVMGLSPETYRANANPMCSHINIGSGSEFTIAELALTISLTVGYQGKVVFDATKPDGAPRKLLDCRRIKSLGWQPRTELSQGLALTYADFLKNSNCDSQNLLLSQPLS